MRKFKFENGKYYHIYNRGVDKRKIYLRHGEYVRFITTIRNLLFTGTAQSNIVSSKSLAFKEKLSFMCYCLMPNHYHLLLQQKSENAISDFMHNLNTSYTKYFNINHKRTGRLLEYTFKAVEVSSDEQLLHVSRYIHLNPLVGNICTRLETYKWSSYLDYVGIRNGILCEQNSIRSYFNCSFESQYKMFVLNQEDYARNLKHHQEVLLD